VRAWRAARAHALDEAGAARAVDPAQPQDAARPGSVAQQPLALEDATTGELLGLGGRLLVDPLALRLAVDGRARHEEDAPQSLSLVVEGVEQAGQTVDVGGAVEGVVATGRRHRVDDLVEVGRQIAQARGHGQVRLQAPDARRQVVRPSAQTPDAVRIGHQQLTERRADVATACDEDPRHHLPWA
jgi:hypothetical protein